MKIEQNEILKNRPESYVPSLRDLGNDPFLLKKEKMAIEILTKYPVPKHLLPKKKNQANSRSKRRNPPREPLRAEKQH
jgi:hypothetical protein